MNRRISPRRARPLRPVEKLRQMLRASAASASVVVAAIALAPQGACAAEPARGGELRVALPQVPAVPDPVVTTLGTNWLVASNVCEGLFGLDETWRPQPMLAQSFAYDEAANTLTVKLRQGIAFHSGAPLTSEDVVASLKRYAGSAGTGAVLKSLVSDISADGPDTVVFKLTGLTGVVPGLLTLTPAAIMSKASLADASPTKPVAKLDCAGPYKLVSYEPDRQVVLERFADYRSRSEPSSGEAGAKHAYADRLIFLPQAEPSVRRDGLITGAIDVALTLPFDFYDALKGNATTEPVVVNNTQSLTVVFNTKQGPAADANLRRAIYHALDMDPIMLAAVGNPAFYKLDPSWVPDANSVWRTDVGGENFGKVDLDLAKKALAQSGYHGEKLRWLTSKDFYQDHYLPALAAQQQLADIGINVDLQVMPAATYIQTRTDPTKFDMFSSFLPTYVDPVVIPYLNKTYPGFWSDPKKEELVKKLAATTDLKARVAIWADIQKLIYDQMPYLKYGIESGLSGERKGVVGLATTPVSTADFYNVAPPPK
jgi:peptide/nickel transport system substrate-binding protein